MSDIPSDLFTNILSLLPVPSLLRFRSTSKSLRTLIDSHSFINLHLKNSLNFNLILRCESKIYQIDFPNLTTCVQLDSPPPFQLCLNLTLVSSCNGLLCIFTIKGLTAFWNPNTRKQWVIPHLRNTHRFLLHFYGFGFDPFTGDYKVVRISTFFSSSPHSFMDTELRLFSSITNSWKLLPNMPYVPMGVQVGVFVHHSLHWTVTRKFKHSPHLIVIAFNLTHENFNEVPLPEIGGVSNIERFSIDVAVLGGCLSMIVNDCESNEIDVWVMKEYGSRDSWCKLFTLIKSSFSQPLRFICPLGYSSDGKKVLIEVDGRKPSEVDGKKLCWYDLKSEQVSYVTGIPDCCQEAMICVESLVLPPSLPTNQHTFKKREGRTSNSVAETGCSSCLWFWK